MTHNKSSKNKVIIKRNKNHKENNKKNQNNFFEKAMKTFEVSGKKSKKFIEMRKGLNNIFNNSIGQKNNKY